MDRCYTISKCIDIYEELYLGQMKSVNYNQL